ncbi:uncharacterized protein ACHE_41342S [Aspergillus chevalieri]|uniref:SUN domain-containing protein n=1 Tax=Aspergillus chevalieri TaxID=182096 RepID=A0A7R7VRE2_ASPCH|nr:uncharacterized protein ACHE_41342S [Aspergillus chevalieri]BCR88778.1 hypothetical protein ACHE_41342S [Aspergillus chevalieri]
MPPKRAVNRRDGPVARSNDHGTRSYLAEISGPQATNPNLPNIPAKPSWGYGSSTAPVFPRQLSIKSGMNVDDMAESIESGVKNAQDRDENGQENPPKANPKPRANSRQTRRSVSASVSPARRRRRREPTPDQVQLLGTLRESTVSPNPHARDGLSTATPSPPIPHAISTESSPPPVPPYPTLPSNEPLYPSPLLRLDSTARPGAPREGSPQQEDSLDNESVISWSLERNIHEDDLQRTRPARFREERHGRNLTAPPRRFSGLAFANETIQEEDEPESEASAKNSPTPEPVPEPQTQSNAQPSPPPERQPEPGPAPAPEPAPELASEPALELEPPTAPTRTIIPGINLRETSFLESSPPSPVQSVKAAVKSGVQSIPRPPFSFRQSQAARIAAILILGTLSVFTVFTFSEDLADISSGIRSRLPFGRQSPYIPLDGTAMDAIHSLSKHVARIDTRVSSLSGEVATVRSEVENMPPSTTVVEPVPVWKATPTPRINFLTQSMGVEIDPQKTSPTVGLPSNFFERATHRLMEPATSLVRWLFSSPEPLGPLAALTHWEDAGDCWCSTPDSGVSQLSVVLGLPMTPEDVAVEHIPKGATADPESAPREMELWAHYVVRSEDSSTSRSWMPSFLSSSKKSPKRSGSTGFSDQYLPREKIMDALRIAYRGEPDGFFSDDELLGPTFYRIGRWTYDINSPDHVQDTNLAAVIDSPDIKVDHVVFRVKSNWGSDSTCMYRLKLYGHL